MQTTTKQTNQTAATEDLTIGDLIAYQDLGIETPGEITVIDGQILTVRSARGFRLIGLLEVI